MGGCFAKAREKSIGIVTIIRRTITGFLAKKTVTIYKEEEESYEREMLLNTNSAEFTAGIFIS